MDWEKIKQKIIKVIQFIANPKLLLCFGIGWMITNGWSYIMMGIGTYYGIGWMIAVAGAYLTFLWLPISPEKVVTVAIAIVLLRFLFPNDQHTLAVLIDMRDKLHDKIKRKKDTPEEEIRHFEGSSMIDNLLTIAIEKVSALDVCLEGLPATQVTVLYTRKGNYYVAENDITGEICKKLEENEDTEVGTMLTMWKGGHVDVASWQFRQALMALNENNGQTDVVLQGKDAYIVKKLFVLKPM